MAQTLKIKETYPAILGESSRAGYPCVIVRLAGCNLRCSYCDTTYAYTGGRTRKTEDIIRSVKRLKIKTVLVTGGEPLIQPAALRLVSALARAGFQPVLETNGSMDIAGVPKRVNIVMDLKTPGSGFSDRNRLENLGHLKPDDEIKFVLTDQKDYLWAKKMIADRDLLARFQVILSPAHDTLPPDLLARWMLKDRLQARLGLQVHKYIFGPEARRV
jgi:7-carboxy-7-deazaguanine synthase